jgi:hypothetical protein
MLEEQMPPEILQAAQDHGRKMMNRENPELSPDVVKKIMAKVQDINGSGIGFSGLGEMSPDKLRSLFTNGLLGDDNRAETQKRNLLLSAAEKKGEKLPKPEPHQSYKEMASGAEAVIWKNKTRSNKNTIIHFNITGRMDETKKVWGQRNDPRWKDRFDDYMKDGKMQSEIDMVGWTKRRDGVTILFDPSNFKESSEGQGPGYHVQRRPKTFRPDSHMRVMDESKPEFEYGFILWHRVAPKYFSGLFLRIHKPVHIYTDEEVKKKLEGWVDPRRPDYQEIVEYRKKELNDEEERTPQDETDPILIQKRIQEVVGTMEATYKDKPEMMVPIYDRGGNLLWPRQMSYEDIQQFVAEKGNA